MDHDSNGQAGVPVLAPGRAAAPPLVDAFVRRFVIEATAAGPLDGVSFAVKDLFDVAGRHTACGNPSWRATHPRAAQHAEVVRRLLAAGARLEGKTRTDELAYSLEGSNFHEGAPVNPAAPSRLTGGSSSGAASATAGGDVDVAIGTDTAGSVRVPAAWCGLIGFRPTHARVCARGLTPLAPSFDTVGWMARSGGLMRAVGAVLLDAEAPTIAPEHRTDLGWAYDPALDALGCAARAACDSAAARRFAAEDPGIQQIDLGIDFARAADCLRVLQGAEAWRTHGAWIEAVRPEFGPGVAERFRIASALDDEQVRHAEHERAVLIARLDAALPRGRLLRLPTVPEPAPPRDAGPAELQRRRARLLPLTALASLSGRPQISLPLDESQSAPLGLSLLGWRNGDAALLQIAAAVFP
jgi:amidase